MPTPNGEDIAENVTAFFNDDEQLNGVMIEHAAELLLPILTAARPAITESQPTPTSSG